MCFVCAKTVVTCPNSLRRPDLNLDKNCAATFFSVYILGESMPANCKYKTKTTLYRGTSYRIGWYVIDFYYRESFHALVTCHIVIIKYRFPSQFALRHSNVGAEVTLYMPFLFKEAHVNMPHS